MAPEAPWVRHLPPHLRLVRLLGQGSFGEVHEAEDLSRGTKVALKVLTVQLDAKTRHRIAREAQVLASLEHPHILKILDRGEFDGTPFLELELLDGASLQEEIPEAPPLEVLLPIADALDHAHSRGILHRDVKSGNILWTRAGRPVLVDFGLVTRAGTQELTATGAVVGSLGYLSPELLRGQPHSPSSDHWAWAVTLYEICELRLPFTREALEAAIRGEPLALPTFQRLAPSDPERRILEAFFARPPEARPRSRAEIEAAGRGQATILTGGWSAAAVASEVRSAPGAPGAPPGTIPDAPFRLRPVLAASLVVLGLLLGGWLAMRGPGSAPPAASPPTSLAETGDPLSERFGEDFRKRVRSQLEHLPPLPESPVTPWTLCLDRDPLRWGDLLRALPAVGELEVWVSSGGRPEDLSAELRQGWREVGEEFSRRGLLSPFCPWEEELPQPLDAAGYQELLPWLREFVGQKLLPEKPGPWTGTALRAAHELEEEQQALSRSPLMEEARRGAERPLDALRGKVRDPFHVLEANYLDRSFRMRSARVMEAGQRALLRLVYALSRALEAEEMPPDRQVRMGYRLLGRSKDLWFGPSAFVPPSRLLGRPPRTAFDHALALRLGQLQEAIQEAAGDSEGVTRTQIQERQAAQAVLALPTGESGQQDRLRRFATVTLEYLDRPPEALRDVDDFLQKLR